MDIQNNTQHSKPAKGSKIIWASIISVIITALAIGGIVYAWQSSKLESSKYKLQQQIAIQQNQIQQLQEQEEHNPDQQIDKQNKYSEEPENKNKEKIDVKFSDDFILEFAYSGQTYPDGFYIPKITGVENTKNLIDYYWIEEGPYTPHFFFCTNDINEARKKIEEKLQKETKYWGIEISMGSQINQNEIFFEFEAERKSDPYTYKHKYRVFKCSYISDIQYLNSDIFTLSNPEKYIGRVAKKPLSIEEAKQIAEFLLTIMRGGNGSLKVIESFNEAKGDRIEHTFYLTHTVGADWGTCDNIDLIKPIFSIDKNSGEVYLKETPVERIKSLFGECLEKPL